MKAAPFRVDPEDPRAPAQAVWDAMTEEERRLVVESLPSEIERALPPEGDGHRVPKTQALEALSEYFRRIRRRMYLSAELPVYYPGEPMFAPDLMAVRDVETHERRGWIVSQEGRGLDFALEIHVSGDAKKDFEDNVVRFARLGIPEYFAFDVPRRRLLGWSLPEPNATTYAPIIPQDGRWVSRVLELDLAIDDGRLRFFHGSAPLLDGAELIARLSRMVDDVTKCADEEAKRADEEAKRADEEA
ncbi:MAG: Uma2 family endonuclease, partial [Myxococcales bacterium]|nr:Uma2 family endonuclease [Myxococcales bacterium]